MKRRYTVIEAAKVLGVGTDAVRKRVARDTVEHERVDDTVYVWLDNGHDGGTNGGGAELLDAFRDQLDAYKDQVEFLKAELRRREEVHVEESRRKDSIIAALTHRIPELKAPAPASSPPERREEPPQGVVNGAGTPVPRPSAEVTQDGLERRSWWRDFFGFGG